MSTMFISSIHRHTAMTWIVWGIVLIVLASCTTEIVYPSTTDGSMDWVAQNEVPTVEPSNLTLARGQENYNHFCAHCHGYAGEGHNPNSRQQTIENGYSPIPAHDGSGHTWQHTDRLLFDAIKHGIDNPLNLFIMAEYGSRLSDDEIYEVIEYIKTFWTEEQRAYQAELTRKNEERRENE